MVGLANSERLVRRIAGVRTGFKTMPNSRDECSNRREILETLFSYYSPLFLRIQFSMITSNLDLRSRRHKRSCIQSLILSAAHGTLSTTLVYTVWMTERRLSRPSPLHKFNQSLR